MAKTINIPPSATYGRPRKFTHSDGAASPVTSPISAVGSALQAITVPNLATFMRIKGVTAPVRVGKVNPLVSYETHAAGVWSPELPVTEIDTVYVRSNYAATTTDVEFRFEQA